MASDNPFEACLTLSPHGEGGRVIGNQCRWSENIGVAAQRDFVRRGESYG